MYACWVLQGKLYAEKVATEPELVNALKTALEEKQDHVCFIELQVRLGCHPSSASNGPNCKHQGWLLRYLGRMRPRSRQCSTSGIEPASSKGRVSWHRHTALRTEGVDHQMHDAWNFPLQVTSCHLHS